MPSDGSDSQNQHYQEYWESLCKKNNAEFININNSLELIKSRLQADKLLQANILLITGGNTFKLLYNLKKSGLFEAIIRFSQKDKNVICGFSAGALVLTPTIDICNLQPFDKNIVNLKDLTSLNLVDFEIFPHFDKYQHQQMINKYKQVSSNKLKTISDHQWIIIDD